MAPLVLAGRLSRKRAKKPADRGGLVCGRRSVRAAVVLFAIRARRLIEGTGKDTGKGLLRIKAVFQADIINPLVGISQVARRQQQFTLANVAPETFPFVL